MDRALRQAITMSRINSEYFASKSSQRNQSKETKIKKEVLLTSKEVFEKKENI